MYLCSQSCALSFEANASCASLPECELGRPSTDLGHPLCFVLSCGADLCFTLAAQLLLAEEEIGPRASFCFLSFWPSVCRQPGGTVHHSIKYSSEESGGQPRVPDLAWDSLGPYSFSQTLFYRGPTHSLPSRGLGLLSSGFQLEVSLRKPCSLQQTLAP